MYIVRKKCIFSHGSIYLKAEKGLWKRYELAKGTQFLPELRKECKYAGSTPQTLWLERAGLSYSLTQITGLLPDLTKEYL